MKTNVFDDLDFKTKVLALFCVSAFGAVVIDTVGVIFSKIFDMGSVLAGYQSLGRYVIALCSGDVGFPEPNFGIVPKRYGETFVGLSAHFFVCLMDTFFYFFLSFKLLKSSPKLMPALILMWLFMSMPLFLEMPALGMGWAAHNSPIRHLIWIRTIVCHSVFGMALYVGTILFDRYVIAKLS